MVITDTIRFKYKKLRNYTELFIYGKCQLKNEVYFLMQVN